MINYFFIIILSHQTVALATYGLKTCCSNLGSIKHSYISMVKQTISKSLVVIPFPFFFLLSGAQYRIIDNIIINSNDNDNNKKY